MRLKAFERLLDGVWATEKSGGLRLQAVLLYNGWTSMQKASASLASVSILSCAPFASSTPASCRTAAQWWLCTTPERRTGPSAPEFRPAHLVWVNKTEKAAAGQKTTAPRCAPLTAAHATRETARPCPPPQKRRRSAPAAGEVPSAAASS